MIFNEHYNLKGEHAPFSPSKYSWVNYDEDKIIYAFDKLIAAQKGTEIHDFARRCIELKQKLPTNKKTLNRYVNDAIGFRMKPEQTLFYSINFFGTVDAICFREKLLRIHDLKTGVSTASMTQLEIYAAFFCLEYKIKPKDIDMELRIYQSDDISIYKPDSKYIQDIMNKIMSFDKKIELRKAELED